MSRIRYAAKNIAFGWIGNTVTMLLGFVLRTIFVSHLGDTLLGVNDLYTDVLMMLSLAELGIGTALNYSLYAPVAQKNREKIKAYMQLYRKAYYTIALVVAVIGIAISPFLKYLVKKPGSLTLQELTLYYFIFLFNTVSTYFVSYKYSLVNAEQKNYIQTNVITVTKMVTVGLQLAVILTTHNFLVYLLTAAAVELAQKIFMNQYLNRLYPYLKEKNVEKLSKEESGEVFRKTKALMLHKIGDTARLQTDSIIISSFVDVASVSFVGNYKLVVSSVSAFVNIIFNSVLSSFGNLIATEGKDKQYQMFRVYHFFAMWVYGFSAIGFFTLLSPLIALWLGADHLLTASFVGLFCLDYFFKGERVVLSNFKTAAGVFEQDKYLTLIMGAVNLVISLALVGPLGIVGVYIGTVISGLLGNLVKPFIIYKVSFDRSAWSYFGASCRHLLVFAVILAISLGLRGVLMPTVTIPGFIACVLAVTVVFHAIFLLVFHRSPEFQYLYGLVRGRLSRDKRKQG